MNLKKRLIIVLLFLTLIIFQSIGNLYASSFKDLPQNHWAYQAVSWMSDNKIISGYPDGTFKPSDVVTRAGFACLLVSSLKLPVLKPDTCSFSDVSIIHWAFPFVETAKPYFNCIKSSSGYLFKPDDPAKREDVAVAVVKALKINVDLVDLSVLDILSDKESIPEASKKYIATAIKNNIIKGYPTIINGKESLAFEPKKILTRAEAAALLYNIVNK